MKDSKAAKKMEKMGVEPNWSNGNYFYIFGEIDDYFPKQIIVPFIEAYERQSRKKDPQPLTIYISSIGGGINFAFDLITQMERAIAAGVEVYTYVSSEACSGASLIAVSGSKRYVSKRAYQLLHFARGDGGYAHNPTMIERNAENFKFTQKEVINIYKEKTKLKDIENKLLADNFMINGGQALIKAGLADEIF